MFNVTEFLHCLLGRWSFEPSLCSSKTLEPSQLCQGKVSLAFLPIHTLIHTYIYMYVYQFVHWVLNSEHDAKESMIYSYTKSFNAFAAKLSKDEAEMLMGT